MIRDLLAAAILGGALLAVGHLMAQHQPQPFDGPATVRDYAFSAGIPQACAAYAVAYCRGCSTADDCADCVLDNAAEMREHCGQDIRDGAL